MSNRSERGTVARALACDARATAVDRPSTRRKPGERASSLHQAPYETRPRQRTVPSDVSSAMAEDVEDLAAGLANEEAPDTPRLVRQRMHDLVSQAQYRSVRGIHVIDFDRDVGVHRRARVLAHH